MGKLDHLKIKRAPAAFAAFARKHNQHVDLLASMQGGPGIDIQIANSARARLAGPRQPQPPAQPRGRIMLTLRPSAIVAIGGGGGGSNSNASNWTGLNVNVVSTNGTLIGVAQTGNATNSYPTLLRVGNNSNAYAEHSQSGYTAINNGTTVQLLATTGMKVSNNAATNMIEARTDDGFFVTNGGNELSVALADLKRDMSIRTINICDNGNTRSIDILASAPY